MKLIYLAHPYGGQYKNVLKSCEAWAVRQVRHPDKHVFNAVDYFDQYKDLLPEERIMEMCLDMVTRCDELWVAPGWKDSTGCRKEIEEATKNGIRVRYMTEAGIEDSVFPV